jgi:hypothetical protein
VTELLARACANALWPELTRERWRGPGSTRNPNHRPGATYTPVNTGKVQHPGNRPIRETHPLCLFAITLEHDPPHAVLLPKAAHDHTIANLTGAEKDEWLDALDPIHRVPAPYALNTTGAYQYLTPRWDPYNTPKVRSVLHRLVMVSVVWPSDGEIPTEAIGDEEGITVVDSREARAGMTPRPGS